MSDGGKGSSPRPFSVDTETFNNNWDAIFGKKKDNKAGVTQLVECLPSKQNVASSNLVSRST